MKTDDDAFVRVDEVLSRLKGKSCDGVLYGHISFESSPHREKENKWYISEEVRPCNLYLLALILLVINGCWYI